ncbi:MAG: S-methyl-5'-thioadenosine phosphorylase [Methanonatronarchaeales archaeon]|nr:S-methyl-5'-thioadenosine phosphorylase [Methanonatronarchaeales archaeon]
MAEGVNPRVGVVGGTGVYDPELFQDPVHVDVETPFGSPSDSVVVGSVGGVDTAFIPRHGAGHVHSPTDLPYRANIYALKKLGVERVVAINAVGSLRREVEPLHFLVPDQVYDRTKLRETSFFGGGVVAHVGFAEPFCPQLNGLAVDASASVGVKTHAGGTYVCIEGPSFSTGAESEVHRGQGFDVIGMTAIPEAKLAREAEMCYSVITTVTDYDVWHGEEVSVKLVVERAQQNEENVKRVLEEIVPGIPEERGCVCGSALDGAVMTDLSRAPEEAVSRVELLIERFLP